VSDEFRTYPGKAAVSLLEEVEKLRNAPLPEVRVAVAEKVSDYFSHSIFDPFENRLACEILRLLVRDVEVKVRKALSENLKSNPSIPHDIALALSKDVLEVAIPILENSSVLTDEDLIEIIQSAQEMARLEAVARRENVSESVSAALIQTAHQKVVEIVLDNKGAFVSEANMQAVINRFRDNKHVIETLVFRGDLPTAVVFRVMSFVSDQLKAKLESDYNLADKTVEDITDKTMDQVSLSLLEQTQSTRPVASAKRPSKVSASENIPDLDSLFDPISFKKTQELVTYLEANKKLSSSLVLRALCEGNLAFFEVGLARLAQIPVINAHTLIWAGTPNALQSLYKRASMPISTLPAIELVLTFTKQECMEAIDKQNNIYIRQRIVERIVNGGYDRSVPMMPYFVTLINSRVRTSDVLH
jgi:uncharacterized protein (DUF2336 family)